MGVAISSHSTTSPLSFASTIIGFVSFALTLATLLRVTWDNITTIASAPKEMPDSLGNLKSGLIEERRYLRFSERQSRRRSREKASVTRETLEHDATLALIRNTIRNMWIKFRELERPFVLEERRERRKRRRRRWDEDDDAWDTEGLWGIDGEDDYSYGSYKYRSCGLRERWYWLQSKSDVINMLEALCRVQTRRIGHETGKLSIAMMTMQQNWQQFDDRLGALENRLSRVVGVRRVD